LRAAAVFTLLILGTALTILWRKNLLDDRRSLQRKAHSECVVRVRL
jgi:hypothetical protein